MLCQVRFEGCSSQLIAGALCIYDFSGGTVESYLTYARMERVSFKDCSAGSDGGALWSEAGAVEMRQVSFEDCTAGEPDCARHLQIYTLPRP